MSFDNYPVETKPRRLTVSESCRSLPRIVLSGAWLSDWGFIPGDRLSAYFVGHGHMLIKALPAVPSNENHNICQEAPPQIAALPILKNRGPHPLTVSVSYRYAPQVTITGAWLREWGIKIGDHVCVTLEQDVVSIKMTMSAAEWRKVQKEKEPERKEANALYVLKEYKDKYPALFEQVANSTKKRAAALKPVRPTLPSQPGQAMIHTREYSTAVAARSAGLFVAS
jgi:hypothetical protein